MKQPLRILSLIIVVFGLLTVPAHATMSRATITVTDDRGTTVTLPATPHRLIALAPNVTEIFFALGLGPEVVGVSSYSDYPQAAAKLPVVFTYSGANVEKILQLKPDLLVAAAIVPQAVINKLRSLRLSVLVTDPHNLAGILHDISLVGTATGTDRTANKLVAGLQRRINRVKALVSHTRARPRVFYELDPHLYTAGHGSFVDALITLAGGVNVAGTVNNPYPQLSAEKVIASDPQYIVLGDASYGTSVASVAARPGFSSISAVKNHRVYPFDDNLASRPGPRIVEGLEKLAQLLHPGLILH